MTGSGVEVSTWEPLNVPELVGQIQSGLVPRTMPDLLIRDDDRGGLLYRGKVNGIHGDSGSGKTWAALYAAAQIIVSEPVVYVDMEDSPADVISRLLALGARAEDVSARFKYVQPELPFQEGAEGFLRMVADAALVVIDSTGESLSLEGANPNADDEIAAWFRAVPKRIAKTGPGVLILDHMPKASESDLWPIGSQRKRAAIDGVQLLLESMSPFSREKAGAARFTCAKDRHGTFARGERVGILHVTPGEGTVRLKLTAPEGAGDGSSTFRPTVYMERVSRALEASAEPLSYRGILDRVQGKKDHIRQAVDLLVADGFVSTTPGPRKSTLHVSDRPFRDGEHSTPELSPNPSVTVPVPLGGERGTVTFTVPGGQSGNGGERSTRGVV